MSMFTLAVALVFSNMPVAIRQETAITTMSNNVMPLRTHNNSIIKTAILLLYVMTHYAFKNNFFSHTKKSKFILFTIVVLQFYLRSHRPLCSWRVTLSIISNSGLLFVTATTGLSKSPFILVQKGTLIPHLTFDFDS